MVSVLVYSNMTLWRSEKGVGRLWEVGYLGGLFEWVLIGRDWTYAVHGCIGLRVALPVDLHGER